MGCSNFDPIYQTWPRVFSQSYIQKIIFISESNQFVFNVFWWEIVWLHLMFSLELHKFLLLYFNILIRWINIGLGFVIKVIFIRCIFRVESKHFIFNNFWWKPVRIFFDLKRQSINLIFGFRIKFYLLFCNFVFIGFF